MPLFLHRLTPKTNEDNPLWLIVLCDLMTNLLLFFLILYGTTRTTQEEQAAMVQQLESAFRGETVEMTDKEKAATILVRKLMAEELEGSVRAIIARDDRLQLAEFEMTERFIKVRLNSPLLFRSAKAELTPEARTMLAPLADLIREIPNEIIVEGHTDAVRITKAKYRTNWELSIARAHSVVKWMAEDFTVPESRFVIAGYGEHHPVAPNDTSLNRARNRRIELSIVRQKDEEI